MFCAESAVVAGELLFMALRSNKLRWRRRLQFSAFLNVCSATPEDREHAQSANMEGTEPKAGVRWCSLLIEP